MKNYIIPALLTSLVMIACNRDRSVDQINADIKATRAQITTLQTKLTALEQELANQQSDRSDKAVKIAYETVKKTTFKNFIRSTGMVEAVKGASISPDVGGKIESIPVVVGQSVRKGQLLIKLEAKVMQNSIAELEKGLELTTTVYNKQKGLWEQGIGSEMQYLEVKNRKESMEEKLATVKSQLELTRIYAPFDGRVEKISMKVGELASPGRGIIDVVNLSDLFVNAEVSETFIASINQGDTVSVAFPDLPGIVKSVPIAYKGNVINPQSRTFSIRVKIPNVGQDIKPNMLARLKIRVVDLPEAVVIPASQVRQDIDGNYVFVILNNNNNPIAHKVYIKMGETDGSMAVVNEGLLGGEMVINEGYNQVREGTPVWWSK